MDGVLDLHYDLAAMVIMAVILLLLSTKKNIPVRRSYVFIIMCIVQVLVIVCSMGVQLCNSVDAFVSPEMSNRFFDLYFAFNFLSALIFMYYMILWSGRSMKNRTLTKIHMLIPVAIYTYMIIDNFIHHNLYTMSLDGRYSYTYRLQMLSAVALYAMFYGISYAIRYIDTISYGKLTAITIGGAAVVAGIIVQFHYDETFFVNFVIAVAMLLLYEVAQHPLNILDGSTQVLNRAIMEEMIKVDISDEREFELIVLAMDDFKLINKTYGIEIGDVMLMQVASFLKTVSNRGKVFRYGSDQFAVQIRPGSDSLDDVLNNITERFRHPWIHEGNSIHLSATTICTSYPEDGTTLESLVEVLDYTILFAKKKGRGSVIYTRDVDLNAMRREKAIEKAVDEAVKNDTLEVHYQPIYNTDKQCYTSAEALVRMKDENLGNISPELFIPIAERTGRIVQLGTMVFEKVCRFIHEQNLAASTIEYIEVNVSVVQCMREDFVDTILSIMEKYEVRPEQINLEITETAEISALQILQENVEKLYEKGITFSLDDYGSGYSTLGYIHQFPFRIIKLDKLMVWDAFETERAGTTLKYTVGMIKELNIHIVAEGVETEQQQNKLSSLGCDYLQGWYYSKAVPSEQFATIIKKAS